MAAMQAINRAILNPVFLVVFVGTALVAAAASPCSTLWTWDDGGAALRLSGGLIYLVGAFALTAAYHVPRNDALDRLDADAPSVGGEVGDLSRRVGALEPRPRRRLAGRARPVRRRHLRNLRNIGRNPDAIVVAATNVGRWSASRRELDGPVAATMW